MAQAFKLDMITLINGASFVSASVYRARRGLFAKSWRMAPMKRQESTK